MTNSTLVNCEMSQLRWDPLGTEEIYYAAKFVPINVSEVKVELNGNIEQEHDFRGEPMMKSIKYIGT